MKLIKKVAMVIVCVVMTSSLCACSWVDSQLNDIKGTLVGVSFNTETYDNYGKLTMTTHGDKVVLTGNRIKEPTYTSDGIDYTYELSSVVMVTIDGKEMQTCGDTVIFAETGLKKELDFASPKFIDSHTDGDILDNTFFAYTINQYKNLFGKNRIVVIKSQMGQPLCAYSGNDVYWEVRSDLPKTTKLMIDGKALYIHRANFQIIDKSLV